MENARDGAQLGRFRIPQPEAQGRGTRARSSHCGARRPGMGCAPSAENGGPQHGEAGEAKAALPVEGYAKAMVVEPSASASASSSSRQMTLIEMVDILKRELYLEGTTLSVVEQGAKHLNVPNEGQNVMEVARLCIKALGLTAVQPQQACLLYTSDAADE